MRRLYGRSKKNNIYLEILRIRRIFKELYTSLPIQHIDQRYLDAKEDLSKYSTFAPAAKHHLNASLCSITYACYAINQNPPKHLLPIVFQRATLRHLHLPPSFLFPSILLTPKSDHTLPS